MTDYSSKTSLGAHPLLYPTPVLVVGTYDEDGRPNIMTAAWGGICCSKPPAIGVSLRKATYSYGNIVRTQAFTLSIPSAEHIEAADFAGIVSGETIDKFQVAGLTPVAGEHVHAPYVAEFPMVIECTLIHTVEIGLHTQFIGEVLDVKAATCCIDEKKRPAMDKIRPAIFGPGLREYYAVGDKIGAAFSMGKPLADKAKGL